MNKPKYNAKKIDTPDGKFDSKREYKHWLELKDKQASGEISNLQRQIVYELLPRQTYSNGKFLFHPITYKADFTWTDIDGNEVIADSKGFQTPEYKMKKKLMYWRYGKIIQEL